MNYRKTETVIASGHANKGPLENHGPDEEIDPAIDEIIDYLYNALPPDRRSVMEDMLRTSPDHQEWLLGQTSLKETYAISSAQEHKRRFLAFVNSIDVDRILASVPPTL